jgi:transposase InsO family protein
VTRQQHQTSFPSHRRKRRLPGSGQTDFTYLKIIGWGWFYLSTVLNDYSRYIVTWKLCIAMAASDVQDTLNQALEETGLDQENVVHRPRLLSPSR